jgi:penicillin-binding protein 1B
MARQDFRYLTFRQAPFKRAYYHATSRIVIAPLIILGMILIGAAFYYYNRYSAIIDAGLRGDIFVRSSGIYAAPLTVRDGSGTRMSDVITHLKKVGYQQGGPVANDKRGYYSTRNNSIDIYPGSDTKIDGEKAFPNLRVTFARNGDGVQKIVDLDNQQQLGQAQIEPELISSVVNQEREKRKIIEYKDLPKSLVDAITAIEDRQFFEHSGINWRGVIRALLTDVQSGELKEGGSSITQQLVKNFFLKPDRTMKRKLSEAYMSVILEQRLSKEEIMAMYCNQIYLGQRGGFSINGFGEAARSYFGKDVSQLSLQESALLAGIIQSPNYLSPFSHADRALERRNKVLDDMVDSERVTRDQAIAAKKAPLGVVATKSGGVDASDAPYFIDYLTRQVESQYDDRGGNLRSLRIYSTVDMQLQQAAYQAVSKHMSEVDKLFAKRKGGAAGLQAAIVAMNPKTGEILAMVGGRDYAQSQLNRATDARRQPGSVFKPFVYAAAIAAGADNPTPITAATTFIDEPKTFQGGYSPSNFGDNFAMGPVTVREALVKSKNVVTVEVAQTVGLASIARLAEKAGLTKVPQVPSLALGVAEATPLQMASAYTAFASGGRRITPIAVKRVTTKDGTTLFESRSEARDVMSKQVAYIMTSMMQDVLDHGTGTRVRQMGFTGVAAGKTGSSRDAWFAGYTPNLVCVVWVGFDDNSDIGLTGGVVAAPIWADFMIRALRVRPELGGYFEDPGGLVVCDIDPATGAAPSDATVGPRREIFLAGTEPTGAQPLPDGSVPNPEASSNTDGSSPTTKPPDDNGRAAAGGGSGMIPLPPDARKPETRPETAASPKWSLGAKLKDFLGLGSSKPKPTPTPTPTPKPAQGDAPQTSQRQLQGPTQAPAPRTTTPLKPVAFNTVKATGPTPSAVTAKPPPRPQVATRPRTVAERKSGEKFVTVASSTTSGKTSGDSRGAPPPKDKPAANKNNEKKSSEKVDPKIARKQPAPQAEIKTIVKQREKPVDPEPKSTKPSPTPTPSPKPSPTAAATPAAVHSVPKGEGTFTLEVCAVSGLLPVRGKCKNTVRQRFKLGGEPTKFCNGSH